MQVLVIFIIFSLSFYVYYKIKSIRSNLPMEKKFISGKSSMALGVFVALFGLNQIYLYQTTVTYFIAALFFITGAISIWGGWKLYQHYLPLYIQEYEKNRLS
ncbi:YtpI family protein [Bacillus sp. 2205SS5-2]|uniref:YtpI family protein n=1 Tax=Bacillus sp. 2205SS5-2 TaxID=3109031 RepID=UPI0030045B37